MTLQAFAERTVAAQRPQVEKDTGIEQGLRFRHPHPLGRNDRTLTDAPWPALGDAFDDAAWIGPTLRARFPAYFDLRFGDVDAIESGGCGSGFWKRLNTQVFLQRHEPGYQLDAHTDIPTRVATCIFSFPPGHGFEDVGTKLLEPLDPSWRCSGNSHHPMAGFRVVDTAPYAPNTCLVFFKTRHSWHSVAPEAADVPGGRRGMQVQLYEPENGAVLDLTQPDLLRNRQFHEPPLHSRLRRQIGAAIDRYF